MITVQDNLKTLHLLSDSTLKDLTLKLSLLLAFESAQECHTLQALSVAYMTLNNEHSVFHFIKLLKTSRIGKHPSPVILTAFTPDGHLCALTALREYLQKTKTLRNNNNQLLISYQKPYKGVTPIPFLHG